MLEVVNLRKLIDRTRLIADQRGGNYVTDAEIVSIFCTAYDKLYFSIIEQDENYFLKTVEITIGKDGFLNYPEDYYKLKSLRIMFNDYVSYEATEKLLNQLSSHEDFVGLKYDSIYGYAGNFYYVQLQDNLRIYPRPDSENRKVSLSYIPSPSVFPETDFETSEVKMIRGFQHYIPYYTASEIADTENVNSKMFDMKAKEWEFNIKNWASSRSKDRPKQASYARKNRRGY